LQSLKKTYRTRISSFSADFPFRASFREETALPKNNGSEERDRKN
jgi:hypothetical protein